jgi:UDP-GlcNAc:undecaprenyl-phosphate GlcNAc-1-phosphate transferase
MAGPFAGDVTDVVVGVGTPVAAFVVSAGLTPVAWRVARRLGMLDKPDEGHKQHAEPVAYLGGVAVLVSVMAAVVAAMAGAMMVRGRVSGGGWSFPIWTILVGALMVSGIGLVDDMRRVRARYRLMTEFVAASLPAVMGIGTAIGSSIIQISGEVIGFDAQAVLALGGGSMWLSPAFWIGYGVVVWLVMGGCNAMNLIDGIDGLCAGVTSIANAGLAVVAGLMVCGAYGAVRCDCPLFLAVPLAMSGGAMGFLVWNYNPARIYLGNAGSMLMGYVSIMGLLLISRVGQSSTIAAACLLFLALPILDTLLAIIRRAARHQSLAAPDMEHLHHMARRRLGSVRRAVNVLYLAAGGSAAIGIAMTFAPRSVVLIGVPLIFAALALLAYVTLYRSAGRSPGRSAGTRRDAQVQSMVDHPPASPTPSATASAAT